MVINKSNLIKSLDNQTCIVNEQILKAATDFIFEDNNRANDFIRKTDPAMLKSMLLNMTGNCGHNQDVIQNDQPGNNEIEDNEIVTEAVQSEEQPEIQDNEFDL